jgi:hypothetical protein
MTQAGLAPADQLANRLRQAGASVQHLDSDAPCADPASDEDVLSPVLDRVSKREKLQHIS